MGMSDSVFDDYVVDVALMWECRNCLALNTSPTPYDTLHVDIPAGNPSPAGQTSVQGSVHSPNATSPPQAESHQSPSNINDLSPGSPDVAALPLAQSSPTHAPPPYASLFPNSSQRSAEDSPQNPAHNPSSISDQSSSFIDSIQHSIVDRSSTDIPLRGAVVNFRSVCCKQDRLQNLLHCLRLDWIVGTESWLSPDISDNEAFTPDITEKFEAFRNDRRGKFDKSEGGGVFILVSKKFRSWIAEDLYKKYSDKAEMLWCRIEMDAN